MGNNTVVDGMIKDGLWDPYGDKHMVITSTSLFTVFLFDMQGMCAEKCASLYKIDRKAQDDYAVQSYKRAAEAYKINAFQSEIVSVSIPGARGQPPKTLSDDEEYKNVSTYYFCFFSFFDC